MWGFRPMSVLVLAGVTGSAALAQDAAGLALRFCDAVRQSSEPAAEALMTPDLQDAIARLRAADADYRRAHPEEKPPLGDGLRLTAFPDGLESCRPEAAGPSGVDLVYAPGSDPAATWRDRLVLVPGPEGGVLIADILYSPDFATRFSDWLSDAAAWK